MKYGSKNGNISCVWNADESSLTISDDGMGIPSSHLPLIFNRFHRVDDSRSSTIHGNGLGLSIVKKLIDLQNFSIVAQSKPDEGTFFTIFFNPNSLS